ncbi:MAG: hypothetical protein JRH20_19780 [Deltaproteobacteria bacterium]|nr:hypothetical protein [Deltaproteobacteria bacterium]
MRGIDGYSHADDNAAHGDLSALLAEAFHDVSVWERVSIRQVATVLANEARAAAGAVLNATAEHRQALLLALGERLDAIVKRPGHRSEMAFSAYSSNPHWQHQNVLELLFTRLLRKRAEYGERTLIALLGVSERHSGLSALAIVGHVERHVGDGPMSASLREALVTLKASRPQYHTVEKLHARLAALLTERGAASSTAAPLVPEDLQELFAGEHEAWLDGLRVELKEQLQHQDAWRSLLALAGAARERSRPTKGWLVDARGMVESIGVMPALTTLTRVFEAAPQVSSTNAGRLRRASDELTPADLVKVLAWSAGALAGEALPAGLIPALQGAAFAFYGRAPYVKAGGGCVIALGLLAAGGHAPAVIALLELGDHLEYLPGRQAVRGALSRAANARKTTLEALSRGAVGAQRKANGAGENDEAAQQVEASLAAALQAMGVGDMQLALRSALEAWRACKSAPLADLVEALSPLAAVGRDAIVGKKEERLKRWLAVVANGDPVDVPRLIDALDRDNQRTALEQFRALEGWSADPRLAAALCEIIEAPPYRHEHTWVALVSLLVGQVDPRTKPRLRSIDDTVHRRHEADPWRVELSALRSALEIRYPQERQLSARAQELVVELVALLPAQGKGDV